MPRKDINRTKFNGQQSLNAAVKKGLRERSNSTSRQKVISKIFPGVERTRIDTERNFLDVLDKVHEISAANVDTTHVFTLSQV